MHGRSRGLVSELRTLADLVFQVRDAAVGNTAFLARIGEPGDPEEAVSNTDFVGRVHALALALSAAGLRPGDRIGLLTDSRPENLVIQCAGHLLGAVLVVVDPGSNAETIAVIVRNSGMQWLFFDGTDRRDRLETVRDGLARQPRFVALDVASRLASDTTLTRLIGEHAAQRADQPLARLRDRVVPEDPAYLVYTTGAPRRAALVRHRTMVACVRTIASQFALSRDDRALSWLAPNLPLQTVVDLACLFRGVAIRFLPAEDAGLGDAAMWKPTLATLDVGQLEALQYQLEQVLEQGPEGDRKRFQWAQTIGADHVRAREHGFVGPMLGLQRWLVDRFVFRRWRLRFGGRLRAVLCDGIPDATTARFFFSWGMPLYPVLSHPGAPILSLNTWDQARMGTAGKPPRGIDLDVSGALRARGECVAAETWPIDPAAGSEPTEHSWLQTTIRAHRDHDGFLRLTDDRSRPTSGKARPTVQPSRES